MIFWENYTRLVMATCKNQIFLVYNNYQFTFAYRRGPFHV
jgi:hypothetical protein